MIKKALSYLTGQSGVFAINAIVGLLIIRLLPISEYSTVVIALFLQVATCVLSDLGLTHALISKSSVRPLNSSQKSALVRSAIFQRDRFALIAIPVVFLLGWILLREYHLNPLELAGVASLSIATGFFQATLNIRRAELNADQNDRALFRVGLCESVLRVALLPLCILAPVAFAAIAINFISVVLTLFLLRRISEITPFEDVDEQGDLRKSLRTSASQLAPGIVYSLFQGQISVLLLGVTGQPQLVAEAGALGRLAQVINLLLVLNPFWVQPYFSRLRTRESLIQGVKKLAAIVVLLSSIIWISVVWTPELWLMIVGEQYMHTSPALRIAMGGVIAHAIFAVSYTLAIARGLGSGQHWAVSLSISLQLIFLFAFGINSLSDALMLQLLPAIGSLIIQLVLIGRHLTDKKYQVTNT
jgi:O-antigen/teichoic acid export membrane protein